MSSVIDVSGPIQFLDDAVSDDFRNGQLPRANAIGGLIDVLHYYQCVGRPIFHAFAASNSNSSTLAFAFKRFALLPGQSGALGGIAGVMPTVNDTPSDDMGVTLRRAGGADYLTHWPGLATAVSYPEDLASVTLNGPATPPAIVDDFTVRPTDTSSPAIRNICIFETGIPFLDPANTVTGDAIAPDHGIYATRTGSVSTVDRLQDTMFNTWRYHRPVFGWSAQDPITNAIEMTTASTSYRYIFDQTIGTGGTAPTFLGPAITLPLTLASRGIETSVPVYCWVYAGMSGNTDTGSLAFANRDSSGSMTAFIAPAHNITISTTTMKWYPAGGFLPSVTPSFAGYAGSNGRHDRVLIGAKSSGSTDHVRIGAFCLLVFPS